MLLITLDNILWLLQTSCSIFIDIACYSHSHVFNACFAGSMCITVIRAVVLQFAFLLPKSSLCPILPLNKNYLYSSPKILKSTKKWQDDSWSGNCMLYTGTLVPGIR